MTEKRTVPMTDAQCKKLQEVFDWEHALDDQLTALVCKLSEERARNQRSAWETVHRLSGKQIGEHVTIDWVNQCLVVTGEEVSDE